MNRTRPLPRPEPTVPAFSYDPKTKQIHIVLDVGDYVPAQLADFFQVATDVMRLVRHRQECCERQVRIDAQIDALRRRQIDVARAYQRLRLAGVKHRAAIRALFIDPTFADLHATTADIAAWVKDFSLTSTKPTKGSAS
jgi:hypothetical protein